MLGQGQSHIGIMVCPFSIPCSIKGCCWI